MGFYGFNDVVHLFRSFAHCKAANGVTGQIQVGNPLHVVNTDIGVGAALVDAPEHLLGIDGIRQGIEPGVFRLAAHQPAVGSVYTFLDIVPGRGIFDALVKGHADIAAQIGLNLHTFFRSHENLPSINVGGKVHAFFLDFPQGGQAEHLESAGVRQNRAVPGHKLMQAAHLMHHLVGGAQMQVVGVGQLHLAADVLQILGTESAFDGPLGAYVHKYRGLHGAVGAGKFTPAGFPFGLF